LCKLHSIEGGDGEREDEEKEKEGRKEGRKECN
jgi:hypothetical protein